jgi:hypothetical protein
VHAAVANNPSTLAARRAFVEACASLARDEEARIAFEITERERALERVSSELRAVSRELMLSRKRLAAMATVTQSDSERFARDYDGLLALPGVAGVAVDGRIVRILTDPIDIRHGGRTHRIGEFAIDLDMDLQAGVRIVNLANTSRSTGWDHPHVQGGAPCLGNLQEGVQMLLGEMELVPLAALMIQFLETFNPTTAYGAVTLWAEVAE